MNRMLLLWLVVLLPSWGLSQTSVQPAKTSNSTVGVISGILLDSISNAPIPYAAVGLLEFHSREVVSGILTEANGQFMMEQIPEGLYTLQVHFIGYRTLEIDSIVISSAQPFYVCGKIVLAPENKLLEEIKIYGEAALIEARPDKIVYNAEKDITSRGGDASDVLRKVPMLSVDFDGNVSLRGSENVRILINGRPSGIFKTSVAEALKMMPADQISAVEVITTPTARYDGEGTAGIINIITKKKNIEGAAGSVDLTAGTRSNRGSMNLNYGKGKIGLQLSGGGHHTWPQQGTTSFRREEFGSATPSLLTQDGYNTTSRLGYRFTTGLEYNLDEFNTFNTSFTYRNRSGDNDNDVLSSYTVEGDPREIYRRTTLGYTDRRGWDWEGDYTRTFKREEQEWSIAFEIDKDDEIRDAQYGLIYALPVTEENADELNNNDGDNFELALQTDYRHPVSDAMTIETGVKASLQQIESDFSFQSYDYDQDIWITDPRQTDIFYYDQNVYAGYISSNYAITDKLSLIAGLRLEVTDLEGRFEDFQFPFATRYSNLLPNITLATKTGEYNQVKISYNQRISRPDEDEINPYIEYNDERDISYGNPFLGPELVHQIELGTNVFVNQSMVGVSLFGRRTEDMIENLLKITDEGISETTYENFGVRHAVGFNAFGSVTVAKKLSIRGGGDFNYWSESGEFDGQELSNTGIDFNLRVNLTWSINETLKVEGFSFYRSPTYTVQGKNPNWVMTSLALRQELFNKKLIVGLSIFQPFRESQTFETEVSGDYFYQNKTTTRPSRSVGLNVGYRFGKLEARERNAKKNNGDGGMDQGGM